MNISRLSATTILVAALTGITSAQYNADFQSLLYPRSILSAGLGEQGVALRSSLEAMQYNPANLVYSEGLGISFFRNPVNMLNVVSGGMPMTYLSLSSSIGTFGNAAIEYTYWDIGEFYVSTAQNPSATTKEHFFEQSFAGACAFSLSDRFDLGAQIRYARHDHNQGEHLLFSTGITFRPDGFSDRLTAGLSLMNFGTRINYPSIVDTVNSRSIEYEISTAPPAQLNLGVNAIAVTNNWFDVTLSFGATKPFARYLDSGAESSFKSLFSNWGAFPRDVTGQIGLGFLWHPLEIVRGISYLQEVYLGYFNVGPRSLYESFYTHGFKAGVEVYGMCATAGYAGRWHNNNIDSYLPWEFPWETFQFTLTVGKSIFGLEDKESKVVQPVHGIVLAAGYSSGVGLGRMKETKLAEGITTSLSIKNIWSFEADFPIDEKSAIVSSFSYSRMKERVEVFALPIPLRSPAPFSVDIEMLSLESGYRYHPLEPFQPFFVQGSLGVTRMKPLGVRSLPNYSYKSYSLFTAGCELPLFESGLIVVPQVGVRTLFMEETVISSRLLGYNHAEYGVKLGYKL